MRSDKDNIYFTKSVEKSLGEIQPTNLLKNDLLKVKAENNRLKNSLQGKDIEISMLKSQLTTKKHGFQVIKINSDNTHIGYDVKNTHNNMTPILTSNNNSTKSNQKRFQTTKEENKNTEINMRSIHEELTPVSSVCAKDDFLPRISRNASTSHKLSKEAVQKYNTFKGILLFKFILNYI